MKSVENLLKASSTGWIAGTEEPSAADFVWYTRFADFVPNKSEFSAKLKTLDDFPVIKDFVERFNSLEAIKEYYGRK